MDLNTASGHTLFDVHSEPENDLDRSKAEKRARSLSNLRPAQKGEVRNPTGRANRDMDLAKAAQKHAEKAIMVLVEVMSDKEATPSARVGAASEILDRGFGRAPQSIDLKATMTLSTEFESFIKSLRAGNDASVLDITPQVIAAE
jgi:hypothetical protein